MHAVKILGEYYFSQLLGKPIYDAGNCRIGWVKDMAVRWDGVSPVVVGLKYARKLPQLIPVRFIAGCDERGIRLNIAFDIKHTVPLLEKEIYISKWLLDKQIIDLQGSKLVRVNDITLSWISQDDESAMVLVAVDTGIRGLFRRLGLEFLFKRFENKFLGLQYMKPLEKRTSDLQLNRDKKQFEKLHPADIADLIEEIDYRHRADFIDNLDDQQAVDALAEMDLDTQVEIIEQLDTERASDLLEDLPPDEAADILGELSDEKSEELLQAMETDEAEEVRELMQYEEDTAGALMTTEFIGLSSRLTADQAINRLRELAPAAETIYYLFITDEEEHLQGVLSLRELIVASPKSTLGELMNTKVVTVQPDDDHAKVADVFKKYGLLAVPVVDDEQVMLGIITVDDILYVLIPERTRSDGYAWFNITQWAGRGH
jgi:CBS domain-containing protein/sporulation protein YlmC with PRC-barrel domain